LIGWLECGHRIENLSILVSMDNNGVDGLGFLNPKPVKPFLQPVAT
jgi:hypothetical protein